MEPMTITELKIQRSKPIPYAYMFDPTLFTISGSNLLPPILSIINGYVKELQTFELSKTALSNIKKTLNANKLMLKKLGFTHNCYATRVTIFSGNKKLYEGIVKTK